MSEAGSNRPLRVFEKVLGGGLGAGNIGVLTSRHGTGKVALLTLIAIDKAMDGHNALHVTLGKSVRDIRAYRDEILEEVEKSLAIAHRAEMLTRVERHSRIHTYGGGNFSLERFRQTLTFAQEHAEFSPDLVEISNWPDFDTVTREDLDGLKTLARDFEFEVWLTAQTRRTTQHDTRHMPDSLSRVEDLISVVVALEPEERHVPLRFVKVHGRSLPEGIHLDFDPRTMLLRWR
ncbi:MAG: hypothetical protein HRU14_17195 [Planctomycetes bacterium]|nr:hypothetical protein [Planctomycetota bacterium]